MTDFLVGGYSADLGGEALGVGRARTAADGRLEYLGVAVEVPSPSWISIAADGAVFAALEGTAELAVLGTVGALRLIDRVPIGGRLPCHLAVTTDSVITACYGDGAIAVHRRGHGTGESPALDGPTELLTAEGTGPLPAQDGPHAHQVLVWDERHVLTVDLGTDLLHVHRWEDGPDVAELVRVDSLPMPPGTGPRDLLRLPDGRLAILGEWSRELVIAEPSGSTFEIVQIEALPGATDASQASALGLSHDGRFLYAGLRGADRIAILGLDADELRPVGWAPSGGHWPRHLVVDADTLHVANQLSSTVTSFQIGLDGSLTSLGEPAPVPSPTVLVAVP